MSIVPLQQLQNLGQSCWLDDLSHQLLSSGQLHHMIQYEQLRGVTSNPAIFRKAFAEDPYYVGQIRRSRLAHAEQVYESLALQDVRHACDLFADVFQQSKGEDGRVSFELAPSHAHHVDHSLFEARRLWQSIRRSNAMIKVPATAEGIETLEVLIAEGISINMTLIFYPEQLERVLRAYESGHRKRLGKYRPGHHAVASFFLSRWDARLHDRLRDLGLPADQTAISLACVAYVDVFEAHCQRCVRMGIPPMRLLWASTAPKRSDQHLLHYVLPLIGQDTVTTLPMSTLVALCAYDQPLDDMIRDGLDAARHHLNQLVQKSIVVETEGLALLEEGLAIFSEAYEDMLQEGIRAHGAFI